jgi:hypothetical protein
LRGSSFLFWLSEIINKNLLTQLQSISSYIDTVNPFIVGPNDRSATMKRTYLIIATFFVTAAAIYAPAQRFFALNHETRQCAGYWGGDEYVTYELPPGWMVFEYELQQSKESSIFEVETDIGTCQVSWEGQIPSEDSCCSQLGYTYISENIGIRTITSDNIAAREAQEEAMRSINQQQTWKPLIGILIVVALFSIIILELWRSSKKMG